MTSSNGNIFRVTGPLCGEFTGEFPTQRPVTRSFDVFFDLHLNKRLSKQPWGWWFEMASWSLWRQCNEIVDFSPCDLEIWWMTSKTYRTPLLHCIKLCVSSRTPGWIQTGLTVRKRSIRVKIGDFLFCVTLKLDGWPWKTIGHLFYVASSFVHFIAIS